VLDSIREALGASPFKFRGEYAGVCTGAEEGVYGWLTVNHQMGTFRSGRADMAEHTVGTLDMGKVSTQIVFIPEKSVMTEIFPVRLGRRRFRLYSKSFLHFGWQEVAIKAASIIISDALLRVQSVSVLHHPCFPLGHSYRPSFNYGDNSTFPIQVAMHGSANFDQCLALTKRIFNKDTPCLVESCSFYGVYQPHLYDSKFVAFSHFARIASLLALPAKAKISDLKVASQYVCSLSQHQVNIIYDRVTDDDERVHLCFNSVYILALLHYGYGFDSDSHNILFKEQILDDTATDYATGAMMYEINQDREFIKHITDEEVAYEMKMETVKTTV